MRYNVQKRRKKYWKFETYESAWNLKFNFMHNVRWNINSLFQSNFEKPINATVAKTVENMTVSIRPAALYAWHSNGLGSRITRHDAVRRSLNPRSIKSLSVCCRKKRERTFNSTISTINVTDKLKCSQKEVLPDEFFVIFCQTNFAHYCGIKSKFVLKKSHLCWGNINSSL